MERPSRNELVPAVYSLAFFLAFALSVVMLITDKNLQTNFGTVTSGYYLQWYGVLAMAIVDLAAAVLLVLWRSRTTVKLGAVGASLLTAAYLGVIATYSGVGFASASQFAQYLFGVTYYGGDIRYLYDILLGVYLGAIVSGVVALWLTQAPSDTDGHSGVQKSATI